MTSTLPEPAPMCMQGNLAENWKFFKQMWNNYEIASGLDTKTDEVRKATLQVVMGQECFCVLQNLNLTQAQLASSVTIVNTLNNYFLPKTNVIYVRYKFNTHKQAHHETMDEYVSALRHLVAFCELGVLAPSFIFATEIGLDLRSFYTAHIVKSLMFTSLRNQFGAYFSSLLARLAPQLVVMAETIIYCKFWCF